jgi:4-diphosphocytidyl-2-C-methyl-D-erythritol kinase
MSGNEAAEARRPARAKLNLYLHIVGRRPDGYHLIDSLFAFAALGDDLAAAPAPALSLTLEGPAAAALRASLASEADNLVVRAARLLADAAGIEPGAALRLAKRLPAAAGLGGGSSDAAMTLRALDALWAVSFSEATLERLALRLGADVPACLKQPRPLFVGGIGEALDPAPALPPAGLLLVNPGVALSTAAVFRARRGAWSESARFAEAPADAAALAALLAGRRNDLEAPAISLAPAVGRVLERLAGLPGCLLARMSGSGATCFGLFADFDAAEAAGASLDDEPAWWRAATTLAAP